jgi:adenylosuccinate lyase
MTKIISELTINKERILENIEITKGQIFAEFVLQLLISRGIPRFEAYRDIQRMAFRATETKEHFLKVLSEDESINKNIPKGELNLVFNPHNQLSASHQIIDNVLDKAENMKIYVL